MSKKVDKDRFKMLDYFDRIFFEVIDATDFMVFLSNGMYNTDTLLDIYETISDYVYSDMLNKSLRKVAKKLYDSGELFDLSNERLELLINEYEQSKLLGCR